MDNLEKVGRGYESFAVRPVPPSAADMLYVLPYRMAASRAKGALLVNKKPAPMVVTLSGVSGGAATVVEVQPDNAETAFAAPIERRIGQDGTLTLGPFATAVVTEMQLEQLVAEPKM